MLLVIDINKFSSIIMGHNANMDSHIVLRGAHYLLTYSFFILFLLTATFHSLNLELMSVFFAVRYM